MKNILSIRILLCAVILIVACSAQHSDQVVVVEKTKTYHTDKCPRVNMANARWMTREEARAMNCKACPGCQPDRQN